MILERVSPNGVSISYRCANCSKSNTVPAATDDIYDVVDNWQTCECLQEEFVTFHQSLCLSHFCEEFSGVNDGEFDPILDQVRKDWNAAEIEATTITFETHAPKMSYETKVREHISAELRRRIWVRDGGICVECSSPNNLQFDHVIPVSKGGATSEDNLQLLCQTCNLRKSNRI
ncbi:MAG: HNH endonuclease [Planctomycetales bacterium]|nr:HNH endonuclease [Planctomycetales bacterium]